MKRRKGNVKYKQKIINYKYFAKDIKILTKFPLDKIIWQ